MVQTANTNDYRVPAPYAAPGTVMAVVQRYRDRDLPTEPFTPQMLVEIGVPTGSSHRTLRTLEYLGLVDPGTNEVTPTWKNLRIATDEEFTSAFEAVVRKAYADVFTVVDPARDSQTQISNMFRRYAPATQRDRMVTLFLGLCEAAGITTLDAPRQRRTKENVAGQKNAPTKTPMAGPRAMPIPTPQIGTTRRTPAGGPADVSIISAHPLVAGLLRTLPGDGNEGWTARERTQWLKTVEAVIDLLYPVAPEADFIQIPVGQKKQGAEAS